MIIKSMSRKQPSFTQLFDYIVRDHDNDTRYNFTHNCFGLDRNGILNEFYANAELLKKRQGSNYLYHEILSITRSKKLTEEQQKKLLRDITQKYIDARAKDCLVFAGLHDEKDNQLHYHLIISANKLDQKKRYYHSKQGFNEIKVQLEEYVLERYPELEQEKLISLDGEAKQAKRKANKESRKSGMSKNEGEYVRRTGRKSKKQQAAERLRSIFAESNNMRDYLYKLRDANIESYVRGKTMGYIVDGKKHRIKTLGVAEEFDDMLLRFQAQEQWQAEQQAKRNARTANPTDANPQTAAEEKKNMDADKKRKTEEDKPSFLEKTGDFLREWVAGDFSVRDKRKQQEDYNARRDAYDAKRQKQKAKQQKNYDAMAKQRLEEIQQRFKEKDAQKKQAMQDKQNRKGNNRK